MWLEADYLLGGSFFSDILQLKHFKSSYKICASKWLSMRTVSTQMAWDRLLPVAPF
jgi:hypothetical protein